MHEQISLALHVLIVLLLVYLIFFRKENLRSAQGGILNADLDGYTGAGLVAGNYRVLTSGATLRRLAQKFSSTTQAPYLTIHNVENPSANALIVSARPLERMAQNQNDARSSIVNADIPASADSAYADRLYTSGALMRLISQEFTSTDQGTTVSLHDVEHPERAPMTVHIRPA